MRKIIKFENAEWAVPDNGACFTDDFGEQIARLLADVNAFIAVRDMIERHGHEFGIVFELLGDNTVDGKEHLNALALRFGKKGFCKFNAVFIED